MSMVTRFVYTVRTRVGLTQEQFAKRLNVSTRTVSRWETGEAEPTPAILATLASFLQNTHHCLPPEVETQYKVLQNRAGGRVQDAINEGVLPRVCTMYRTDVEEIKPITCTDCNQQAQQYDHRDYLDPIKVEPVCQSCNVRRGLAIHTFFSHFDYWAEYDWLSTSKN